MRNNPSFTTPHSIFFSLGVIFFSMCVFSVNVLAEEKLESNEPFLIYGKNLKDGTYALVITVKEGKATIEEVNTVYNLGLLTPTPIPTPEPEPTPTNSFRELIKSEASKINDTATQEKLLLSYEVFKEEFAKLPETTSLADLTKALTIPKDAVLTTATTKAAWKPFYDSVNKFISENPKKLESRIAILVTIDDFVAGLKLNNTANITIPDEIKELIKQFLRALIKALLEQLLK